MVAKHYGIRGEKYKLIHYHQFDEWELFDLEDDPLEQTNLYDDTLDSSIREKLKNPINGKKKIPRFSVLFQSGCQLNGEKSTEVQTLEKRID